MTKEAKPDFRKTLNFMLNVYYHHRGPLFIHKLIAEQNIPIPQDDLTAGFNTLLKDGHVEHILPGYSTIPLGAITGQGRIFIEQGGYKDNTTRVDKMIKLAKNHPVLSKIIFISLGITSISGLINIVSSLIKLFSKP